MPRSIGVVVSDYIAWGVVEGDSVRGTISTYPADGGGTDVLQSTPADEMVARVADEVKALAEGEPLDAIGLAFPGIVQNGIIKESPNLHQLKGVPVERLVREALAERGVHCEKVCASNDADVVAAGIAARHGKLDQLVRVWMLGNGIGFGIYPVTEGVWEGGHTVVTLDPNEKFCGCGGRGHLEGIMGHRAMRLRFLDLEPEEVFEQAKTGEDPRCVEFVIMWHRALAAATASSIHMSGPGKFYISGPNSRFVNVGLLNRCVQEMVKMSSLQGFVFEVVPKSDDVALVGAVVNALRA
ncbi:MAG TPA: ROK family protein [Bryobacteraceae bacterium]|nr:ROK family protein [Bryobacteraceae bacterium]